MDRNFEQNWSLDQLGNWPGFKERDTDTGSTWDLEQVREHNAANEITDLDNTTGPPWDELQHDAAGNIRVMPLPVEINAMYIPVYDAWNRLISSSYEGDRTYEYDGLGRRIRKMVNATTWDYYYNEDWQLLEERRNGDSDPLAQYVWHPYYIDALAVRYFDFNLDGDYLDTYDGTQYYLQDANFNVTAVVDAAGDVLERYQYSPYGEVTFLEDDFDVAAAQHASAIGNTHLYTGRERDSETGLQLNRHRYYASHLGRWVNRDPMGYYGSPWNLVEYVASDPVLYVDPDALRRRQVIIHPSPSDDPFERGLAGRANRKGRGWENIECDSVKECADRMKGQPGDCISKLEIGGHGLSLHFRRTGLF